MSLQAGVAVVDITPQKPMFLVGYPHVPRTSEGVHDPLLATALCLKTAHSCLVLVSVDILFVDKPTAARCRAAVGAATGVPPEAILISATHTHSGPVTFQYLSMTADPIMERPDPEYMAYFEADIVRAATTAIQNTTPAAVAITKATIDGVGCNRLSPDAVRDPEANLLVVRRQSDQALMALALAYAMHPTVLHEDSRLISADFPAFTRQTIQERYPGVAVLYHTAPSGNQSPRYHVKGQTFAEAERLGKRLGTFVNEALAKLTAHSFCDNIPLRAISRTCHFEPRQFPPLDTAQKMLEEARQNYADLKKQRAPHGPVRTAECVVFGAEERVVMSQAQAEGRLAPWLALALPAEVLVLQVGDAKIVGLPGELFVEYALQIKERLGVGKTFVISLANGELQGYIVTPEAELAGGYEAGCSMFTAAAGAQLLHTVYEAAASLA